MKSSWVNLPLSKEEASAVSVALVGLIHDPSLENHDLLNWAGNASVVAKRLETLREIAEET